MGSGNFGGGGLDPRAHHVVKKIRNFQKEESEGLNDIEVTEKDINDAINKLDENSAADPDGILGLLRSRILCDLDINVIPHMYHTL